MPNYRESASSAVTWRRASSATIYNPLPGRGVPSIRFEEQDVVMVDGRVIAAQQVFGGPGSEVAIDFDADATFALLDVETGASTGKSMTHAELRAAIYSLYMAGAKARDGRAADRAAASLPPA